MTPSRRRPGRFSSAFALALIGLTLTTTARAEKLETVDAEGQPLAANVGRLLKALKFLGSPLPQKETDALQKAIDARDSRKIQQLLDTRVLALVSLSPEARVKAKRGPAPAVIQQG